jgi:hypothetical protein
MEWTKELIWINEFERNKDIIDRNWRNTKTKTNHFNSGFFIPKK